MNLVLYILLVILPTTLCNTTESPEAEFNTQTYETITTYNKTVSELVNEQTEAIKHIIAAHKPLFEQPLLDVKEAQNKDDVETQPSTSSEQRIKEANEKETIDELRKKCEYYFKLFTNKQNDKFEELGQEYVQTLPTISPFVPPVAPHQHQQNGHIYVPNSGSYEPFSFSLYADNQIVSGPTKPQPLQSPPQFQNTLSSNQHYLQTQQVSTLASDHKNQIYVPKFPPVASSTDQNSQNLYGSYDQHQNHYVTYNKNNPNLITIKPEHVQSADSLNLNAYQTSQKYNFKPIDHQSPVSTQNFNYVQLEPVVLQKTLVSDGKTLYYWFRKLPAGPNYAQIPSAQANDAIAQESIPYVTIKNSASKGSDSAIKISNHNTLTETNSITSQKIYEAPLTTTKTPSYNVIYPTATTEKPKGSQLHNQLKFVIPLLYPNPEVVNKNSWQFDPFAYYPKPLQPNYMRLPVPYEPTFHIIRALNVPNSSERGSTREGDQSKIDDAHQIVAVHWLLKCSK